MYWRIRSFIISCYYYLRPSNLVYRAKMLWVYGKYALTAHDWDWAYLIYLINIKLKYMQSCFEDGNKTYAFQERNNRLAKQMSICRNLLQRIVDDNYCQKELDIWHNENPVKEVQLSNGNWQWKTVFNDHELASRQLKAIYAKIDVLRKADLELFWKIFGKHFQEWWD